MKKICLLLMISSAFLVNAQVPKMGNDTLIDIACWNIEWFGDATNGPSNEALQFNNVKSVLQNADIDVWALEEISDATAWANLTAAMPDYGNTITTYSQTQKTGLIWNKNIFDFISSQSVLTDQTYYYDFAGRPPLEVVLKTKINSVVDTIYFYVLHLKAYGDLTSYGRRQNASGYLKTFLETNRADKKVIVLGDWNDDLNSSTYNNSTSPFANFVNDSSHFFFPTKALCDQGKSSYITGGKMLDEQMLSTSLKKFYVNNSCRVVNELPTYISGYLSDNTSDHYPVLSFYNTKRYASVGVGEAITLPSKVNVYPNPSEGNIFIETTEDIKQINLIDQLGKTISYKWIKNTTGMIQIEVDETLSNGIYFIQLKSDESIVQAKVLLQR